MVKRLLLPEVTVLVDLSIDFYRRVMQPRVKLLTHFLRAGKRSQKVDVVGHDHIVSHAVSVAIKVQ